VSADVPAETGATPPPDAGAGPSPGAARMVEVGGKEVTEREAVAVAYLRSTPEAVGHLMEGTR
jgi:molybdenum cofactor biosynthesis enzyme